MSLADTPKELETNYLTIGKILGGAVTGLEKGTSSYEKLIEHMEKLKIEVSSSTTSGALETACYLYVDDGSLRVMTSGTYVDMLIGYTGAPCASRTPTIFSIQTSRPSTRSRATTFSQSSPRSPRARLSRFPRRRSPVRDLPLSLPSRR